MFVEGFLYVICGFRHLSYINLFNHFQEKTKQSRKTCEPGAAIIIPNDI